MIKILRLNAISRPLSLIIMFSFLTMVNGCYYFKVVRPTGQPAETISSSQDQMKFIILHFDDKAWQFKYIKINEDSITGVISTLIGHERYKTVKPEGSNRYLKKSYLNDSDVLNEVHIYVSGYSDLGNRNISIKTNDIQKIEVYDKDNGATAASWIFSGIGVGVAAFAVILLIVALTKSSCPFVYTSDGSGFLFAGEIFSGATQPGLERDDFLKLSNIVDSDRTYRLKLTNEVKEIQNINYAGLICVDHPSELSVQIDKYGQVNTFRKADPPLSARNSSGKNLLGTIRDRDTLFYSGDETGNGRNGIEEVFLKFVRPKGASSAKLIIRAKNTFWLDLLFTRFHRLFGERYNLFSEKQESTPGSQLKKFLLDQKIPLSVYLEKNGNWEFADYFNIAGPMALRDDILPIDLSGINSDTINVKLETGFLFWELDYAGIDFSKNEPVIISELTPNAAVDNYGTDVSDLLVSKDKKYMVLNEIGDEVLLSFNEPRKNNNERTLFLNTRGYYKILRDQSGSADRKALKTFRKPNRFPKYSEETYDMVSGK
jgi:hypothetical protein